MCPKRCGYFAGKAVTGIEDTLVKLKAALDARRNPDFVICGRMDIGVDMTFVQGADTVASLARVCREVPCPQLANVSQASNAVPLTPDRAPLPVAAGPWRHLF